MKSRKSKPEGPPIAVIEEVADHIYSIKFILQSLGYSVRSFGVDERYEDSLTNFGPRLIVVDMMIPDGKAFRAIRGVRQSPLKSVPVLAITADAMEGDEQAVYDSGGQDVLSKPYSVAELQEKLGKLVRDSD